MWMEILSAFKNVMITSGIEAANVRLVMIVHQPCYSMPQKAESN
jgi:hypothetical protein